jgi:hypothetical protein
VLETVIGEIERFNISDLDTNTISHSLISDLVVGLLDHALSDVDAHHIRVWRVRGQVQTDSDRDF